MVFKRKTILLSLLLCVSIVLCSAAASAVGGADDPFISLSYLKGTFLHALDMTLERIAAQSEEELMVQAKAHMEEVAARPKEEEQSPVWLRAKEGDMLTALPGALILLLDGECMTLPTAGTFVDLVSGTELPAGTVLDLNCRYLVTENAPVQFLVSSRSAVICYDGYVEGSYSDQPDYYAMADALRGLSLFRGTGESIGDGYALEKIPTRIETLIMLLRLLGEEQNALAYVGEHPFTDVPDWCDRYVAYAYAMGYSNGIGGGLFGTTMEAGAEQYMEFVLRALRYSSTETTNIADSPERAVNCGVLSSGEADRMKNGDFRRADIVYVSYYALDAAFADGQQLWQRLRELGVFTDEQYRQAKTNSVGNRIM